MYQKCPFSVTDVVRFSTAHAKFIEKILISVLLGRFWHGVTKIARFHAKEHPAFDKDVFPYNMGYCQKGKVAKEQLTFMNGVCLMYSILDFLVFVFTAKVLTLFFWFTVSGSNMVYDESMNLRNILWLAPLPSTSSKDWLAPGKSLNHIQPQAFCFTLLLYPERSSFLNSLKSD